MAYKTNRLGIGLILGQKVYWDFYKSTQKKAANINKDFVIKSEIKAFLLNFITLPKKRQKTRQKTKEQKRFKIPISVGSLFIEYSGNCLNIFFNFFLDHLKLNYKEKAKFVFLSGRFFKYLSLSINKDIKVRGFNIFSAFSNLVPRAYLRQEKYVQMTNNLFFKKILLGYSIYMYRKNRYFDRLVISFAAAFVAFDGWMLADLISREIANLRKLHGNFLKMVYFYANYCHDVLSHCEIGKNESVKTVSYIDGTRIFIRGRLTMATRQMRRKHRVWIISGKASFNVYKAIIHYGDSEGITRYGVVNVKVWINAKPHSLELEKSSLSLQRHSFGMIQHSKRNQIKPDFTSEKAIAFFLKNFPWNESFYSWVKLSFLSNYSIYLWKPNFVFFKWSFIYSINNFFHKIWKSFLTENRRLIPIFNKKYLLKSWKKPIDGQNFFLFDKKLGIKYKLELLLNTTKNNKNILNSCKSNFLFKTCYFRKTKLNKKRYFFLKSYLV